MTLTEKLERLKESELYTLTFNGKVLGIRVKIFDVNTEKFMYYDFDKDNIHDKGLIKFLNSVYKNLGEIALKQDGNGLLVSDEEVKANLTIDEFESEEQAIPVLRQLQKIYASRG